MEEEQPSGEETVDPPDTSASVGEGGAGAERSLSIPEAAELRGKTQAISQTLQAQVEAHLETLRTLLAPRRILGKYAGASARRDDVSGADKVVAEIRRRFKEVAGRPFMLKSDLPQEVIQNVGTQIELYPWEYDHEASAGGQTKTIAITSPVRWVMTYASDYSLHQLRDVVAGREEKRPADVRQFVVNCLVMGAVVEKLPNIARLLEDLRFEVSVDPAQGLGELPLVTLSSNLASFRPADDLILTATGFSGVDEFVELVDRDAVQNLRDPLREKLAQQIS